MATTYPPTPAQMSFVTDLLAKRAVPAETAEHIKVRLSGTDVTGREVSSFIDTLKAFPWKPNNTFAELNAAFAKVEDAKYAVPADHIRAGFPGIHMATGDDLLFVEVKTFKGKRYLSRLHGAPGDFIRSRFPLAESVALLTHIAGRHIEFSGLFGKHFTVCGRCAAPLTDPKSREMFIGPECRKVWGL